MERSSVTNAHLLDTRSKMLPVEGQREINLSEYKVSHSGNLFVPIRLVKLFDPLPKNARCQHLPN